MNDDRRMGEALLATMREARVKMCLFRHNVGQPGIVDPPAKLLFVHGPEMCKALGAELRADEGFPPGIVANSAAVASMAVEHMANSRGTAEWCRGQLGIDPKLLSLFAVGRNNAMDAAIERLSVRDGFRREDRLALEGGRPYGMSRAARLGASQDAGRGI